MQVLLLREFGFALERKVVASTSCTHLHHLQAQFVFFRKDTLLQGLHLFWRDMVDVHPHRFAHRGASLQRPVLIGQAAVVHLNESALQLGIAASHSPHH